MRESVDLNSSIKEKSEISEKSLQNAIQEIKERLMIEQSRSEKGDLVLKEDQAKLRDMIDVAKHELREDIKDAKKENSIAIEKVEREMQLRREDVISLHNKVDKRIDQIQDKYEDLIKRICENL